MTVDSVVTIRDAASGSSASILPGVGFNCFRFTAVIDGNEKEVIWAEPGFSGESALALHGIPLLFPFAGRLRGSSFQFQGKQHDIPGEMVHDGNVLHGFVISRPSRVTEVIEDSVTGEFQASVDDPSLLSQWPADFRLQVRYLVTGNSLVCDVLVENPDQHDLPFGFGTHPYFHASPDAIVTVPADQVWLDDGSLPTGERAAVSGNCDLRAGIRFADLAYDGVLTDLQAHSDGLAHTTVSDPVRGVVTEQTFAPALRNCVVWTPPHREAVAIEPWSCVPDAFSLEGRGIESGLDILPPGASWATRITISANGLPG